MTFKQATIWRYVKRHGPLRGVAIAAHFGDSSATMRHKLRKLVARGCMKGVGNTHHRMYTAIGSCPKDQRGLHPEATINLAQGRALGRMVRWQKPGRVVFVPRAVHALDAAMRKR